MAPENTETVPILPDAPQVEPLDVAPEPPATDPAVEIPPESAPSEPPAAEPPATTLAARGNFDAGLQRVQRENSELRGQITNLTKLVTQALTARPTTPTAEQTQSATISEAEKRATDLVASLDQQIAAANPDSEGAVILKGLKDLAVLTAQQAKDAREEIGKVRSEATAQVQQVVQQSTVWTKFDQDFPHLVGKGPLEWQKIVAEGKAEGIDPTSATGNAVLSDRFIRRAKESKPTPGVPPLRTRPSGSAPSAPRQPGARIPTDETDQQIEQRERNERDAAARKVEAAFAAYAQGSAE
jgi:hypothetical protein